MAQWSGETPAGGRVSISFSPQRKVISINRMTAPIQPIPKIINKAFGLRIFEDVSFLISWNEKDGNGVPVLLKQYLKLNGKNLSFSIDEGFSGVVDGLLMVDLRDTDTRLLRRLIINKQFNSNHRLPDATKKENHVHS
jgi:hypothetical protein